MASMMSNSQAALPVYVTSWEVASFSFMFHEQSSPSMNGCHTRSPVLKQFQLKASAARIVSTPLTKKICRMGVKYRTICNICARRNAFRKQATDSMFLVAHVHSLVLFVCMRRASICTNLSWIFLILDTWMGVSPCSSKAATCWYSLGPLHVQEVVHERERPFLHTCGAFWSITHTAHLKV